MTILYDVNNEMYAVEKVTLGTREIRKFTFDTTPWAVSPTPGATYVEELVDDVWVDRTATMVPTGTATAVGNVITSPLIRNGVAGHDYVASVLFTTADGQTWAAHIAIHCEK